ncbi:MAG: BatD family protein, partial [bacterium]
MSCSGEGLTAVAEIESQHAFMGEPLSFRIRVTGSDTPVPDLTGVTDFSVRDAGVSQSSRSSFTIIMNGRQVRKDSGAEIVFSYELVPKKTGVLTVPAIAVVAQGATVRTAPIQVKVDPPSETSDFKMRLSLSKTRCYAGEPVVLRVVWYIGARVGNYQMSLPVLENDAFTFADPHDGQFTMVQI